MQGRSKHSVRYHLGRMLAAAAVLLILAGGAWSAWRVDAAMQTATHAKEPLAAFEMRDGDAVFSFLGLHGTLPLRSAVNFAAESFTSISSPGRLLFWAAEDAGALWREQALPYTEELLSCLFAALPGESATADLVLS